MLRLQTKLGVDRGTESFATFGEKYLKLLALESNLGYQKKITLYDYLFNDINDFSFSMRRSFCSNISSIFNIIDSFCFVLQFSLY